MIRASRLACLVTTVTALASLTGAREPAFGYPPSIPLEEVRQWIDQAPREHPCLLADGDALAALRGLGEGDSTRAQLAAAVIAQAELMRGLPPVTRKVVGRRLLAESRRCLKRVLTLAMAYHLTGDDGHVRRAQAEMLAAAAFEDWNPSHFLDTAEMTLALAIGYDWLHDVLDEKAREAIRTAIVDKGVALQFGGVHDGWVDSTNNWGQVCHGGLTAGALAVMAHEPDLAARTVHSAVHNVTHSMTVYAPRGSYPEGPGYWSYGTNYNVLLIAVLRSVLGTDFGLSGAPGFDETGQYPALATGPSGLFFNYADGSSERGLQPALFWFAARYARPDWHTGEPARLREALASLAPEDAASGSNRWLPLALLWMGHDVSTADVRMPLHWNAGGETPVTVHRSSWHDPNATYVGLKGGSPSANHGQMDVGSFVLDADGVRWAADLGAEPYHGVESRGMDLWNREQDSERWTIFRLATQSHNTLVIDGEAQRVAGHGEIVGFSDDSASAHSIVDMTSAYAGQATSIRRGVALLPSRAVLVQDELAGLEPGSRVRWGMVTPGAESEPWGAELVLRQEESSLKLMLLSPLSARLQIIDTATPRNDWDSPNPGTRMVAFEAVAPDSGELRLSVLLVPGSAEGAGAPELRPLSDW